jgi:hypothetical protein
VINLVSEPTP